MQYGEDSRPFVISSLLDEIDFRQDPRTAGQKDLQKVLHPLKT
jgi:hypothetical protein